MTGLTAASERILINQSRAVRSSASSKEPERYHIRGLTRNTTSPKAQQLAQQGVELVQADLDDAESLQNAFAGAHIIYAMTDFWQSMSAEIETEQGKRIVNAAENVPQLEHFVWASLPDGKALSQGEFSNIFHWQSKADVAKYMRDSKPELWSKTIEILFPNYMENCVTNAPVYLPVKVSTHLSRCVALRAADSRRSTRMERTCALLSFQARRLCPTPQSQTPASW